VSVAVVVVNFRTAETTIKNVTDLLRELAPIPDAQIFVVDNQSNDGSLDRLREAFSRSAAQGQVTVVDAGHNGGYGFGINVGVRNALLAPRQPRYIYIINPDAVPEPGSLAALLAFIDAHPEVGLVGSSIRSLDGAAQAESFRFPSVWSELEGTARIGFISRLLARHILSLRPSGTSEVDWVSGTSMLVRTEVFTRSGWFDQGFFLYFEEIDFARRLKNDGWKVFHVADAPITHVGSLATGMADESRPMPGYWFESRRRYFLKHHGILYAAACDVAWLAGHAIFQMKSLRGLLEAPTRPRMGRDFLKFGPLQWLRPAPYASQNRDVADPAARDPEIKRG
jgi:GT2 family glycosyltransferase